MADTTTQAPPTEAPKVDDTPTAFKAPLAMGGQIAAIVPQDFEQCYRMAQVIKAAGMAPKSLDSVEKITIAIMQGLEVGLKPMQAVQSIAVINNMPTIYGDAMLALVMASPVYGEHDEWQDFDEAGEVWSATFRTRRKGSDKWTLMEITRARAQRAGWWNKSGPWKENPQRMLQMRARGWGLRDAYPDVLRGLVAAEEIEDMIDVTAQGSATTAPPRPERRNYVDVPHDKATGEVEQGDQAKAAETQAEPEGNPWLAIGKNREEIGDSLTALLDRIRSLADIAAFEAANKENIEGATSQIQRRITLELMDLKKSLGGA